MYFRKGELVGGRQRGDLLFLVAKSSTAAVLLLRIRRFLAMLRVLGAISDDRQMGRCRPLCWNEANIPHRDLSMSATGDF